MYKILLLLCLPVMLLAQKQKLAGTVMNNDSEKLQAVQIELYDSKNQLIAEIKTDADGNFTWEGISETDVKIVVKNKGYSLFEKNLIWKRLKLYKLFLAKNQTK